VTSYIVLRLKAEGVEGGDRYERMGKINAHGALAALRKAGEQWGDGTFVAVPESRWSEETVTAETVTRVRVGA
jgi:hypothetical protein